MQSRLKEAIEGLTEPQKREYLDLHSQRHLFVDYSTLLKRTTITLSTDLSEDEIRAALSTALNVPIEMIPSVNFEKEKSKIREQGLRVEEIIASHKEQLNQMKAPADKLEELYDIGRFIQVSNLNMQICPIDKSLQFPDFKIMHQNTFIGIEHTRLLNEEIKAAVKTAKYYIKQAETILKPTLDSLSKTINIYIDYDVIVIGHGNFCDRNFTKSERYELPQIIANYVKSQLTGGDVIKPSFIRQLEITSNRDARLDLELGETYTTRHDFFELLLERVARKEVKANRYRNSERMNQLWLVVVIDDVNSFSGFDLSATKLPRLAHSNFDKIYLFEKYGGKIYSLDG